MAAQTGLVTGSAAVVLDGVADPLIAFAQHLAMIHKLLFGIDLVVTSGKDSIHSSGSLHAQGKAIDVRTKDKDELQQVLFISILAYASLSAEVAVFDERALGSEAHIHIEYHGA